MITEIDEYLESLYKPKVYWGKDGVEVQAVKGFERTCILISQHIGKDAKVMTTLEFLQSVETLKSQIKQRPHGKSDKGVRSIPR